MVKLVVCALAALLTAVAGIAAAGAAAVASIASRPFAQPSAAAIADIPADYLTLYQQAAAVCPGLDWSLLAAVGKIESDHGRSNQPAHTGESPHGVAGVMQILPDTWNDVLGRHAIPPGGAKPPSRHNAHDAIHAAAFYLCDHGAPTDPGRAIAAYNPDDTYVQRVLAQAALYRATGAPTLTGSNDQATLPDPTGAGGHLTPHMHALYQALHAAGATTGGAACWDPHPYNPASDHPRGKACDIFFDPHDPADVARGWRTAYWLITVHSTYAISYIIWQGRIWSTQSPTWRIYRSSVYNCPNPHNITGCHYDHIHVSVNYDL